MHVNFKLFIHTFYRHLVYSEKFSNGEKFISLIISHLGISKFREASRNRLNTTAVPVGNGNCRFDFGAYMVHHIAYQ
jgi:hypothetical protein